MKNVTEHGTEVCIRCGSDTGVPFSQNVADRIGYIEGAGQTCPGGCKMSEWKPIATAPNRQAIFIFFRNVMGKARIIKAMRAGKFEIEEDGSDREFSDYNEANDTYYWPPGWYEDVYAETGLDYTYHHLGSEVEPTHWMPLPPPPKEMNNE